MNKKSKKQAQLPSDDGSDVDAVGRDKDEKGGAEKKDAKQSNTIIQQINGFSMTPMNDRIADQTIEDHKYLLELVENKAAIAYFAVANRNQSLFNALKKYLLAEISQKEEYERLQEEKDDADPDKKKKKKNRKKKGPVSAADTESMFMDATFNRMLNEYDFMSVVMYPELKKRREFVHDAWLIAKLTENMELKIAISNDPYFYITRDDILQLLKTKDDQMIQHMLKNEIILHIREDVSYKLVKIKNAQVNQNQQTIVQLVDFISVLVMNKRADQFSYGEVIFPHSHIVDFLETHSKFMVPAQAIKVFIMSRKFRLALQYLTDSGVEFEIDFFTFAIESNAYEIVFYLRYRFEEQIFLHNQQAIDAHVQSYQNQKFLKSKLHLSKSLLPIFNFNGVKQFLAIMSQKIFDHTLEGNIFSHSANPLLTMCLTYEFLFLLTKRFFSLSYTCKQLMEQVKIMIIEYIESVDDENFLTSVMLEKDFTNRDSLQIAVELEVLDLIQAPKVEAVIKRIWNSDFDTSGSFFEMSTAYQILIEPTTSDIDVEVENRFYNKRDIEGKPQNLTNFNIFQESMFSRLLGMVYIAVIYVTVQVIYFEQCIEESIILRPHIADMRNSIELIAKSSNDTFIEVTLSDLNIQAETIQGEADKTYAAFVLIRTMCFINLMYFISQMLQIIFLKKIGRVYTFPTISLFTDLLLFITSCITINWIGENITKNVYVDGISEEEVYFRKLNNFEHNIDFKFEYLFSIIIFCLLYKVMDMIQFSTEIGPLVKIVGKMAGDFYNFVVLYVILVIMFGIVGNLNFLISLQQEFGGLFQSILTVLDASIGNYSFEIFKQILNNDFLVVFGDFYVIIIVITFNILILNLIIAILSNTYNMFDTKSTGLYLSKILNSRDEMTYDENYGAFLLTMTPLNIVTLPFVPYALFKKPSKEMNTMITVLQYSFLIVIIYLMFLVGSIIMTPFAFLKSLSVKIQDVLSVKADPKEQIKKGMMLLVFLAVGLPILVLNLLADFYYFWMNNFRSNLKKIIIDKEKSTLTNQSIRDIVNLCSKYSGQKIRSVYSIDFVKSFRQSFQVQENIQYLLFGQMMGGDPNMMAHLGGGGIKSLKTTNLRAYKNKIQELENYQEQTDKSKHEINQYNNIKIVLMNFSYMNGNSGKTLGVDIIIDVMDELRRERKIAMVLADADIEQYIQLDLSQEVDLETAEPFMKKVLTEKKQFRENLCQKVSILRLGYMFRVLKTVHPGKASMLSAEAFKVKVIKMENKQEKRKKFGNKKGEKASLDGSMDSQIIREERALNIADPLLLNVNGFINEISAQIQTYGQSKLKEIEGFYKDYEPLDQDERNQNLDTIEENLKAIEKQKSAGNDSEWI